MAPLGPAPDFDPAEPWAADPDAWRAPTYDAPAPDALALSAGWPQLAAPPLYWMWLERLERQRGGVP